MKKWIICSVLMLLTLTTVSAGGVKNVQFYQRLLEEFCKTYFSEMFEKRTYVYSSLHVESVDVESNGLVVVKGRLSYEGRWGKPYPGMQFKANIREKANAQDTYFIVFEKEGEYYLTKRRYWESSSKTFVYRE